MHGAFRLRPRATSHLDQRQPTGTVTSVPTFEITSSTLTIDIGPCCGPTKPPHVRPSNPSQTEVPVASPPSRSLPVAAVVAITVGTALLLFSGICLLFAFRRRAARRRRTAKMHHDAEGYRPVAMGSDTPPSQPALPATMSSLSSLSTRALLDLGFAGGDHELFSPRQLHSQHQTQPQTPDRRSVDTVFALRFYGQERTRHPGAPFIAELPATPLRRPVPAPPPTPPPSTTPPLRGRAFAKRRPAAGKGKTYLNPAGEPWVCVPPPAMPLPAPPVPAPVPAPKHAPRTSQDRPRPTFSLFPTPQKPPARPQRPPIKLKLQVQRQPRLQNHRQNQNQTQFQNQPQPRNFSRPSPIKVLPPTFPIPAPAAPASAPPSGPGPGSGRMPNGGRPSPAHKSPPLTASGTMHFPPPPGQPDSGSGRKSFPGRLWDWGVGLGSGSGTGTGSGTGAGTGAGMRVGTGWRSPGFLRAGQ